MAQMLWEPSPERVKQANLTSFMGYVNQKHDKQFKDYFDLYDWSIQEIAAFQEAVWEYFKVIHSQGCTEAAKDLDKMPGTKWFVGARLNFAENLLRFRDDRTAIVFKPEVGETRSLT